MDLVDLEPATRRMARLISRVPDDLLDRPTPCPAYTLGDLIEHVGGLALAFTAAATKDFGGAGPRAPRVTPPGWAPTGAPASPRTWPPWPRRGATRRPGRA